jgi:primosomal protein N'
MPRARLKGRHRWHLTLKGRSVERLHEAVAAVLAEKAPRGLSGTRILVDVDPIAMS